MSVQQSIVTTPSSTLDSLPKPFVTAMRTLFDIMDDKHTGYVNFSDIENRWQDDGTKGLPKGVLESLQKVTPPNGMLSFERFCAGLKICLLRNQVEKTASDKSELKHPTRKSLDPMPIIQPNRPPSAPLLDINTTTNGPATIKPSPWLNPMIMHSNPSMSQQRTLSMPQLTKDGSHPANPPNETQNPPPKQPLYGPPKPPRLGLPTNPSNIDRAEIRNALQNWQMGLMMNDQQDKDKRYPDNRLVVARGGRGSGDGKPATQNELQQVALYQKKTSVRRREPRRHTLQNGIDYNMLKRMKQIEQEKDVLMQGLSAIEKAREWYLKQVTAVQEKMKDLGRMGSHMESWSETQQERLELQRARVLEVNRHLATLTCSWERGGLPLHMNLAVHHVPTYHHLSNTTNQQQENTLNRLKQQNHLLTEEVSQKSERISVLEREKAALIRELLQTRANQHPRSANSHHNSQEEAVF